MPELESPPPLLHLLGDPLRWTLARQLARSDRLVEELVFATGKPHNLVSYHLRLMREAHLVRSRRSAQDGRGIYYSLDSERCAGLLSEVGESLHLGGGANPSSPYRRVAFLCTENGARSQMAEALLAEATVGAVEVASAGSRPGRVHPLAVEVLRKRGVDISGNRSKHLDELNLGDFDLVVTVCDRVRGEWAPVTGRETKHWSIPDPADPSRADESSFEKAADELVHRIRFLVPHCR